jgi:hypothetical protein
MKVKLLRLTQWLLLHHKEEIYQYGNKPRHRAGFCLSDRLLGAGKRPLD